MQIRHFYDKALAQGSYAIESNGKIALVDPARDPVPYLKFAQSNNAEIVAVFETHPHADFISSHLEFHKKYGATIYINEKVGVSYPHTHVGHNDEVKVGDITIRALFTPGHSPDHNSYLLIDKDGKKAGVFTGDSLFVGDVGRPDLREGAGNIQVSRKELAGMMFDTIQNVFAKLPDDVVVYPAHGAGSLCGKNLSDDLTSTIGNEKNGNWAFSIQNKEKFVETFLEGQAFIPKYFPNSVEVNRKGAESLDKALHMVKRESGTPAPSNTLIVDTRMADKFRKGHLAGAINIQNTETDKFETWLGSILGPDERFFLVSDDSADLERAVYRAAKIGYEGNIISAVTDPQGDLVTEQQLDISGFKSDPDKYTIVDIRNASELESGKFFDNAVAIPLPELRERVKEIPTDKPVVVHCAGGYRSAAGASILKSHLKETPVYDLSDAVKEFQTAVTG